jgi:hypothetical protein
MRSQTEPADYSAALESYSPPFAQQSIFHLSEEEARQRPSDCAAQHGLELSQTRLNDMSAGDKKADAPKMGRPSFLRERSGGRTSDKQHYLEQNNPSLGNVTVGKVHFLPDGTKESRAGKTLEFGLKVIRAVQDFVLLAEAGSIKGLPDVLIGKPS